jgi:hypothetical protein
MARLTVGLASAVTFGALSVLVGARAVDVDSYLGFGALALALFGITLLLPVREGSRARDDTRRAPRRGKTPRPSARRRRDKSPHPGSFRRA